MLKIGSNWNLVPLLASSTKGGIEGHNRLVRIPSKNGIVRVKAHEVPSVGGLTIHLMLGKTLEKECLGGYGMLCVMRVLDEFGPKEANNFVSLTKCVKQVLDEFPDVMFKELPDELPPKKNKLTMQSMSRMAPPAKAL